MTIILLALALIAQPVQISSELLKVSIYYEAHCPGCANFISQQFYSAYQKISSLLNVHFVPYGRATHTLKDGEWEFTCEHGVEECRGNKMQACGIAEAQGQDNTVEFVSCMMNSFPNSSGVDALEACVTHLNVTSQKILDCVESSIGSNLLAKFGNETRALYPLAFMPTIIFDDKFDNFVQSSSVHNFHGSVIHYLAHNNACKIGKDFTIVLIFALIFKWY